MSKRVPKRSPEMVQISITLPAALLDAIDNLAEAQDRKRSNLIAVILKSAIKGAPVQQVLGSLAQTATEKTESVKEP